MAKKIPAPAPKPGLHCRAHEMGLRPRIRTWTDAMADYGQFDVRQHAEAQAYVECALELGFAVTVHCCDGTEPCRCPRLERGQQLNELL